MLVTLKINEDKFFVDQLINWYKKKGRKFLWRTENPDPYTILISEVMLQKTVASNVQNVISRFLNKFPDIETLAKASIERIEEEIKPLGIYRRRAKALKKMAEEILYRYRGEIPKKEEDLLSLPMVGKYVASALRCFAFNEDVPVIDVNVSRVMKRVFDLKDESQIEDKLLKIIPKGQSKIFNWALLDFGSLVCRSKNPLHDICPIAAICKYLNKK